MTPSWTTWARPAAGCLLACVLAVGGFVAWSWPLASTISSDTLVLRADPIEDNFARAAQADWNLILANDQTLSLWGAVENARSLASRNWHRLVRQGQCWPMPASTALGEHMIELGVLALPWWQATHDPVASYNYMLATALLVAASGMFLFVYRQTGSISASIVGGLAFAFATPRLVDLPYHPAVVGTHWIPWVLWSFDRSLAREGFGSFAIFGVTLLLSGLVGSYPLLAIAVTGGAYGAVALFVRWRDGELEGSTLAWLVAFALPALAVVGALVATYARTQADWMLMPNTGGKFVVTLGDYLPGGLMSIGAASLAGLVPLALLGGGVGGGAVSGLLLTAAFGLAIATAITTGSGTSWSIFEWLAGHVALLDSVRAPGKVGLAVCFAVQALGAIGWARLFDEIGKGGHIAIATLLLVVVAVEASPPVALRNTLGNGAAMELRTASLPADRAEKLATALAGDDRPVLDLPLGRMVKAPLQLLDAAYHGHETSACYNSLVPPTMRAAYALASHGHSARTVAELAAAGFGYVIERQLSPTRPLQPESFPPPARLLVFEEEYAVWQLPPAGAVHHDATRLSFEAKGGGARGAFFAPDPPWEIDVEVRNDADVMWAASDPPVPLTGSIELGWKTMRLRGVLPLALDAHQSTTIQLVLFDEPPPGSSGATVTLDGFGKIPVAPDFVWSEH